LKQSILLGTYGWRHAFWSTAFYPEDLPTEDGDDWRLSYYSNEFNTVLVPASYWQSTSEDEIEDWLDNVHKDFHFFVQCHADMFETLSLAEVTELLKQLSPQLAGLVFLVDELPMPSDIKKSFIQLAALLEVKLLDASSESIDFIVIEDALQDLRASRAKIEPFLAQLNQQVKQATIIVKHPQLQAENLAKFRSVLDIMGY